MSSRNDLRPCPFCGSEVAITDVVSDYGISCPECGLIMMEPDTEVLIRKWNRRDCKNGS